jgi:glycosyltransferase involved in cell wall biosynthesis
VVRLGEKFDLFIGVGPYYNLAGLLLKSVGFVKHVLYYAGDYFPLAEDVSVMLNFKLKLFHFLDSLSVRYSDGVWSSLELVRVAHSKSGVFPPKGSVDFVAPLGLKKHRDVFVTTRYGHELVYFGSVQRGKGIELLIEVMPELIRKVPDVLVNIVGTGSMEDEFRGLVKNLGFERYFNFFGYIPNGQRLDEILGRSSLGLALFDPRDGEFSQYVNPGKVMEYISRGIPPVISKNIQIASDISEMRGGYCIDYSSASLCRVIISAFTNEGELSEIKHNLEAVANKYEWESILSGVYDIICKRFGKI